MEYIFIMLLISFFKLFRGLPYLSFLVDGISIIVGLSSMADKGCRQRICVSCRNLFVSNKQRKDENGNYIVGNEGEVHAQLQAFCHMIESINLCAFNITNRPRSIYNELSKITDMQQGINIITQKNNNNFNTRSITNPNIECVENGTNICQVSLVDDVDDNVVDDDVDAHLQRLHILLGAEVAARPPAVQVGGRK